MSSASAKHRKRRNTVYNQEKEVNIVFIYQIAMCLFQIIFVIRNYIKQDLVQIFFFDRNQSVQLP